MSRLNTKQPVLTKHLHKYGIAGLVHYVSRHSVGGADVHTVKVSDGYDTWRYSLQRLIFYNTAAVMNRYLAKRPDLPFEHRRNIVRKFLYHLPSFSKWAALMDSQGSLAMEPLHDPEVKHLINGSRIDPITRRLFRHGADPMGIRSRTVMAAWLASDYVRVSGSRDIRWLSLAGGSALHAVLMIEATGVNKERLYYANIDINPTAIERSRVATRAAGLLSSHTRLMVGDIFDEQLIAAAGYTGNVDIVDMMGILEYLDDDSAQHLVRLAFAMLRSGGIILTCNMRRSHPQLDLHQRGVGWPGVLPRTTAQLIRICSVEGVHPPDIEVYQPLDGVYNIIRIKKN